MLLTSSYFIFKEKQWIFQMKILNCVLEIWTSWCVKSYFISKGAVKSNLLKIPDSSIYSVTITNVHICAGIKIDCVMVAGQEVALGKVIWWLNVIICMVGYGSS